MNNKQLIRKLENIEVSLDILNGDYGCKEYYCIFCNAKNYNGCTGVLHNDDCVMFKIRNKIKQLKED